MPTAIPIPQIKLGKRKERSQMCEILTDDGQWIDEEIPALSSCVADDKRKMAFLIDPANQFRAEDGYDHQLITEKTSVPLSLRVQSKYQDGKNDIQDMKSLRNSIFRVVFRQKQTEGIEEVQRGEMWDKAFKIVVVVSATILVIVGIRYFTGAFG